MDIYGLPRALAAQPENDKPNDDDIVLNYRDEVEIMIVLRKRGCRVNPRQNEKNVNIGPPGQQQAEVEISEPRMHLAALLVW